MILIESILDFFTQKTESNTKETSAQPLKILPYGVRYALRYRGGNVGPVDVLSLAREWCGEAVYASIKILENNLLAQRNLLQELCEAFVRGGSDEDVRLVLERSLSVVTGAVTTNVKKLAEISRMGPGSLERSLIETTKSALEKKPDHTLMFLAYTCFIGLREIVTLATEQQIKVYFIVPEWLEDEQTREMGYCFDGSVSLVRVIQKSEHHLLPKKTVFVDDSIKTGVSFGKVEQYWRENFQIELGKDNLFVGKVLK
ncbi:MAG: hypothetical protein GW946_02130 [Candidatus Pacebacteria bacterium]|nr:hypothetical protein [Candidatus Paceibacterota bacterium]PIR60227.1 MAG: hypothetical protein COU67_03145 [Candidatus Pacebacteria bacterium CG10_big_fil_rev_8_21_14_0_10_44_54]